MSIKPSNETAIPQDGGTFTFDITTGVTEGSWWDADQISDPYLNISVSSKAPDATPRISGVASSSEDYDVINQDLSQQKVSISAESFDKGTISRALVRVEIPENTENLTLKAEVGRSDTVDNITVKQYTAPTETTSWDALARQAESRKETAAKLNQSYQTIVYGSDLDDIINRGVSKTFITAGEFTKDLFVGYLTSQIPVVGPALDNLNTATQFAEYADSLNDDSKTGPWIGPASRAQMRMLEDGFTSIDMNYVENAGNTSYILGRINDLAAEEAEAWRNHNRERALTKLKRQREYLTATDATEIDDLQLPDTIADPDIYRSTAGDGDEFNLVWEAERQRLEAQDQPVSPGGDEQTFDNAELYFKGVGEYTHQTEQTLADTITAVEEPKPTVTLDNEDVVRDQLATQGTVEATFTVSNTGGPTTIYGFLSLTYTNETLELERIEQVDEEPDGEVLRNTTFDPKKSDTYVNDTLTNTFAGDDQVLTQGGDRETVGRPVTDIFERFSSGETNAYRVTFNRTGPGSELATIGYRTAFQPLLHEDGQQAFIREPVAESPDAVSGVQGWAVYNVTESNLTPTAEINLSVEKAVVDESVTLNGSASTDPDGSITQFEWDIDDDGAYERSGSTTDVRFDESGSYTVSLRVTDSDGVVGTTNTTLQVVEPPTPVLESFERNRSTAFVGETIQTTATVANDGGEEGTFTIYPAYDGLRGQAAETVTVAPGESVEVVLNNSFESAGKRELGIYANITHLTPSPASVVDIQTRPLPVIQRSPGRVVRGETVSVSLGNSHDPDGEITEYLWDIDDDGEYELSGPDRSWSISEEGFHRYRVRLVDNESNAVSRNRTIAVRNATDWPGSGVGPGRTNTNIAVNGPTFSVTQRWSADIGNVLAENRAMPAVGGETVYASTESGITAFNAANGSMEWTADISGEPHLWGSILLVGETGNGLAALDRQTGEVRWQTAEAQGDVTVRGGTAFTSSGQAVEMASGEIKWETPLANGYAGIAVGQNRVVLSSYLGPVTALYPSNGTIAWRLRDADGTPAPPAVADGTAYVGQETATALNLTTGELEWETPLGESIEATPAVTDDRVYYSTKNTSTAVGGRLYALNRTTGDIEWTSSPYPDWGVSSPVVAGDAVYVATHDCESSDCSGISYPQGNLQALNSSTGELLWNYTTEEFLYAAPAVHNETVYIDNGNGQLLALESRETLAIEQVDTPATATTGEQIQISANLSNDADSALTRETAFTVADADTGATVATASKNVTVAAGDSEQVGFNYTIDADQAANLTIRLTVGTESIIRELAIERSPEIAFKDFRIGTESPPVTIAGSETRNITVDVANTGDWNSEVDVTAEITDSNGTTQFKQTTGIAIDAGQTDTVTFEHVTENLTADQHTVTLSAGETATTGSLTVEEMPDITNVSVAESVTNDTVTVTADIEPGDNNLTDVTLGVSANFTSSTTTTSIDTEVADGGQFETTLAADDVVADGEYSAFASAVDKSGYKTVQRGEKVLIDTTAPELQLRVANLTGNATVAINADEQFTLTDVGIKANETNDRTPTENSIPNGRIDSAIIPFDSDRIGGDETIFNITISAVDAAGNEKTVNSESVVTEYHIDNGATELTPADIGSTFELSGNTTAIGNETTREAVVTDTETPPAETELATDQIADGFVDVEDIGLNEAELTEATVRIPLSSLEDSLTRRFNPSDLNIVRSADGDAKYKSVNTSYNETTEELVTTVKGFSQFAVAGTDDQPPEMNQVTVTPERDLSADEGPATVEFDYSPVISPINVSATEVSVNVTNDRTAVEITKTNATVEIADFSEGESVAINLTLVDEAGNELTTTEELVVGSNPKPVEDYTNNNNVVETSGLRGAIEDWVSGNVNTDLLRTVIEAWVSGRPV